MQLYNKKQGPGGFFKSVHPKIQILAFANCTATSRPQSKTPSRTHAISPKKLAHPRSDSEGFGAHRKEKVLAKTCCETQFGTMLTRPRNTGVPRRAEQCGLVPKLPTPTCARTERCTSWKPPSRGKTPTITAGTRQASAPLQHHKQGVDEALARLLY